jgi:PAS domain S-box-containing protein
MANDPLAPFGRDEGLALLAQAETSFEEVLRGRLPIFGSGASAPEPPPAPEFREGLSALRSSLAGLGREAAPSPETLTGLRVSYYRLEQLADRLDGIIQGELRTLSSRLDLQFVLALWFVCLLLVGVCGAVYAGIRARAAIDRKLRESRELLVSIVENSSALIYVFDVEGRCILSNRSHALLFGKESSEIIGRLRSSYMDESTSEEHRQNDLRVIAQGRPITLEERNPERDGEHTYLTTKFPLRDAEGGCYGVGGISTDITARKRDEARLKVALAEKDTLLRELYHRTKNNMQVICSMLSIKSDQMEGEGPKAVLEDISNHIYSMALVHEKLYQSQNLSSISMRDYLQDLIDLLLRSQAALSKAIAFDLELAEITVSIEVAIPIGLIVTELITNSLRHAFAGRTGGEIRISLIRSGDAISLEVSDNGVGFPAGFDWRSAGSMGMKTIDALGEQIHGSVEFASGEGVACRIVFREPGKARI